MENGEAARGGGIHCYYASPSISNCTITGNIANNEGGGIYCHASSAVISNCTIAQNRVVNPGGGLGGGGIYSGASSQITVTECMISLNSATNNGGGIYCEGTSPAITNCMISDNLPDGIFCNSSAAPIISGCTIQKTLGNAITCIAYSSITISASEISNNSRGFDITQGSSLIMSNCTVSGSPYQGIRLDGNASATITDSTITNNGNDGALGGGVHCASASLEMNSCMISGNTAEYGGGVYCSGFVSPTITNCTFSTNDAEKGGGIYIQGPPATITHCTIADNSADSGGGLYFYSSAPSVSNCVLWGNNAAVGSEISMGISASPSTLTVSYSDVQGGETAVYVEPNCTLIWLEGNIDADPLFVGDGDYHLTSGSPCIDAGADVGVYTDIDGDDRPLDAGFDMGSDEFFIDCWDDDGDGYEDEICGGDDCDDIDPYVNPGAMEICDNGIDDDCDGLVDLEDYDCAEFTLDLDASYESGMLNLNFTIGTPEPTIWNNNLILTVPSIAVVNLWAIGVPAIYPPVEVPVSFSVPSLGWVGIYSELLTAGGLQANDLALVYTGP